MGASERAKGARKEREIARKMGGKRMVMSGGSVVGGGDLVFPTTAIWNDWMWEVKARKLVPEIIFKALEQARVAAGQGSLKKPAAVICADNRDPVVCFYLDDLIQWAEALNEMGSGAAMKSLIREARRVLEQMEGMV